MATFHSLFGDHSDMLRDRDFQLLLLSTMLPVLGASLLSPVLDSLIEPFRAAPENIGLMISFFTGPAIVIIPIMGVLADRIGRKPILTGSIVLFGLSGTAIAFTSDFQVALGLRILQGIGFAGISPIIITSIGDLYEGESETTGQGLRFMVSGFSGALFPLLAGVLVVSSWQYPFLLYSISFPIAGAVVLWFEEPKSRSTPILPDGGVPDQYIRRLFRLSHHRHVFAMVLARAILPMVWVGFITYNSLIVVRLMGGSPVEAGILATIWFLTFAISAGQSGRLSSHHTGGWKFILIIGNIAYSSGIGFVVFAPNLPIAIVGIVVSGLGFGLLGSFYRTIITSLAPSDLRAGLVSLSEAGGQVMSTVTPILIGAIIVITTPELNLTQAIQAAIVSVTILSAWLSIFCIILASRSPPAGHSPIDI